MTFAEEQIVDAPLQSEAGRPVAEVCRKVKQLMADLTLNETGLPELLQDSSGAGFDTRSGHCAPRRLRRQCAAGRSGSRNRSGRHSLPERRARPWSFAGAAAGHGHPGALWVTAAPGSAPAGGLAG